METLIHECKTWSFSGDVAYFKLAFLVYFVAWIAYVIHLVAHRKSTAAVATSLLIVGLLLHSASIAMRAIHAGKLPSISTYEMVSTTIWGIVALYMATQRLSKITVLGAFVMPVALGLMVYALGVQKSIMPMMPVLHSFWLYIHIPIAVVAYGAMAVVFGLAFAYMFRDGRDNLVWGGIGAVIVLLGLGMFVGSYTRQAKPPVYIAAQGSATEWRFRLAKPLDPAILCIVNKTAGAAEQVQVIVDGGSDEMSPVTTLGGEQMAMTEIGALKRGKHTIAIKAVSGKLEAKLSSMVVTSTDMIPSSAEDVAGLRKPLMIIPAIVMAILGLIPLAIGLNMTRRSISTGESRRAKFWLDRLPSLKEMDSIMSQLISLGFVALTLVIITGAIWAADAWGRPWNWDPKEIASLIPWLFYVIYLHTRHIAKWRGLPSVTLLFFGYFGVIFCLILVNLLPSGLHGYAG